MRRRWGTMTRCWKLLLFLGISGLSMLSNFAGAQKKPQYTLGFLTPAAESEIPTSLAIEWESAFRVAVEVLNSQNRSYALIPHQEYSDCDWQAAYHGSDAMTRLDPATYPPIIGIVGPACSGAAMSSITALKPFNISIVSFAATASVIETDREFNYNLFRTVYSDTYQAEAIALSISKMNMTSVTLIYTLSYYSLNLAQEINATVNGAAIITMVELQPGTNSSIDSAQLKTVLANHAPTDFVILCMHPQEAFDVFASVQAQGELEFPWWYFGTDGVTALDPVDVVASNSGLANNLVGEIGLAPYGGDYSQDSICQEYYTYWQNASYPGLPVSGVNKSRSYTPYLIDTVRLYFEVCDNLLKANLSITPQNVLNAFMNTGLGSPTFQGCTGLVNIDPKTGSRNVALQPPIYDFVSFTSSSWEAKGRIESDKFITLQPLQRPNSQFAPGSAFDAPNPHKSKAGAIIGGIFAVLAAIAIVAGGVYLYKRRHDNHYNPTSFVRVQRP